MRALLSGAAIPAFAAFVFVMPVCAQQAAAQQARAVDASVLKAAGSASDPMPGTWLSYGRTQAAFGGHIL